jgi:hypothetical protein
MLTAEQIKEAIISLPEKEYVKLRDWFLEKDWEDWDKQIEHDIEAGKLDFLIEEARNEKRKKHLREL